jgi:hypothetical protein
MIMMMMTAVRHSGTLKRTVTHTKLNHTIGFVDERNAAHTNTIKSTWQHVKAFLNPNNRVDDYICHLPHYMFAAGCRSENVDQCTMFIGIVASTDWNDSISPDPSSHLVTHLRPTNAVQSSPATRKT